MVMKIRYPNTIMVLTSFVFFNLWVWEFSVKRWQLICLKTLLRFSFISCFKSTIFVIVCLLNTYHSFLWRENPKILLEDLNNQKKILKDNGIDVDDKNVPSTNCWWVFILKLLLFRVETTVMVYGLKDWTTHIYIWCIILFYLQCSQGMYVSNAVLAIKCLLLVIYILYMYQSIFPRCKCFVANHFWKDLKMSTFILLLLDWRLNH